MPRNELANFLFGIVKQRAQLLFFFLIIVVVDRAKATTPFRDASVEGCAGLLGGDESFQIDSLDALLDVLVVHFEDRGRSSCGVRIG